MRDGATAEVLLVHNEDAGDGSVPSGAVRALIEARGLAVTPCACTPDAIRAGIAAGPDFVVAAGGDGTVALVVQRAAGSGVPVAPLPLGGLNNIATVFDVRGPIEQVVAGWRAARHARVDCGRASGAWGSSCFVEAVGFGALAAALGDVPGSPETADEKLAAGRAAFRKTLVEASACDAAVTCDGARAQGRLLAVEVLNLPMIGPRLPLAPAARPDDGRLDVVVVREEDRAGLIAWLDAHCDGPPPLRHQPATEIIVEGFAVARIDDPRRAKDTSGAAVHIGLAAQAELILPAHVTEPR